jgi:hypothetical protein
MIQGDSTEYEILKEACETLIQMICLLQRLVLDKDKELRLF